MVIKTSVKRNVCTKKAPMTRTPNESYWEHPDARETDYDGEYYIEYKCPNCFLIFTTEMPD